MNAHVGRVRKAETCSRKPSPKGLGPAGFDQARYEAYRPALIAYHQTESPWMSGTLESLRKGWPMNDDNRRTIRALVAAMEAM